MARALVVAGANVTIVARDRERLQAAAELLTSAGAPVTGITADVTRQEDVQRMISETVARHGRLDLLVNNAGRSSRGELLATSIEEFQRLLEMNFYSVVRCTQAAAPHLQTSRGHLVNIGSLSAKAATRYLGAYPVSKFAVAAYTQQLRLEWAPHGAHVLLVCPGPIARADAGKRYDDQAEGLPDAARRPGGGVRLRGIDPDKLAAAILVACERRQAELVVPAKARYLFALAQLWPQWSDWIIRRKT